MGRRVASPSKRWRHLLAAVVVFGLLFLGSRYQQAYVVKPHAAASDDAGMALAIENYGSAVQRASAKYNLDFEYLMALLMLECGGKNPPGERYEPHVFKKLKQVRDGQRSQFEHVTSDHLNDASDEALKNLATSWGPFQLMGYKCILLGVNIRDIRGPNSIDHGANWINQTYGSRLRSGKFKDCFHMHNAGTPFPKSGLPRTHSPQYVPRGLAMMGKFSSFADDSLD